MATRPSTPTENNPPEQQPSSSRSKSSQRIFPIRSLVNIKNNANNSTNTNPPPPKQRANTNPTTSILLPQLIPFPTIITKPTPNNTSTSHPTNNILNSSSQNTPPVSVSAKARSVSSGSSTSSRASKSRSSSGSSVASLISPSNRTRHNDGLPSIAEGSHSDSPQPDQSAYQQKMGIGRTRRTSSIHFRLPSMDSLPPSLVNSPSSSRQISPTTSKNHQSASNLLLDMAPEIKQSHPPPPPPPHHHASSSDANSNSLTNNALPSQLNSSHQPMASSETNIHYPPSDDVLLSSLRRPKSTPSSASSQTHKSSHPSTSNRAPSIPNNTLINSIHHPSQQPPPHPPQSPKPDLPPTIEKPVSLAAISHAGFSAPNQSSNSDPSRCSSPPTILSDQNAYTTTRFEYQESHDGLLILTGRKGQVTACEDEPIRMPGAIQAFGVLIAVVVHGDSKKSLIRGPKIDPSDPSHGIFPTTSDQSHPSNLSEEVEEIVSISRLEVVQVSENSGHILGLSPNLLLNLYSFTEVLTQDQSQLLCDNLEVCLDNSSTSTAGPHTFRMTGRGAVGTGIDGPSSHAEWSCWCATHRPDPVSRPRLVVIEFELENDEINPPSTISLEPAQDDERGGVSGKPYEPTEQDLIESTMSINKPLRALSRLRRKGRDFSGDSVEVLSILTQVNNQFDKSEDMPTFLKMAVGLVRELTGFDRVMIYKFDESWNGQVVAELVDWKRTRDLYRGLRFPASDIPAQARELYKINRVRMLYDRDQPTARLMCKSEEELMNPLDMTHCHLRAMSPIHIKYLANMGVRASFSISIVMNDELWGLISCHSYGKFGQRVTFPTRHFCRILGDAVSRNIHRLHLSQRLQSRKLINTTSTSKNPSGYIVAKAEDLLWLFDAQSGVLSIGEEAKILGTVSNSQEILAILEFLRFKAFDSIQVSTDINQTFPDAQYPGGFESISGLLLIPLSRGGQDFICFFRPAQMKEIHWAGNPHEKILRDDKNPNMLEPRKSFKIWSETVKERSKAWSDDQLETGSVLSLVYGKFIDVWRQKEAAVQNNQLQALLLSNASHEVRTPLHQILSTLELALDGQLDEDTRDNLSKSYSASRALVHVINDLLDLTKAEQGGDLFSRDPFHLESTIEEAVSIHQREAERKAIKFELVQDPRGAPAIITGDRARLRQVVSNLVGNAVKHTTKGFVHVQWGHETQIPPPENDERTLVSDEIVRISVSVTDTGKGIPEAQLENIFRAFEQVGSGESDDDSKCESIGLGLAVVGRVVHNMGGQLRVDSTVNRGSKFTIVLPFMVPKSTNSLCSTSRNSDDSSNLRLRGSDSTSLPSRTRKTSKLSSRRDSLGSNHGSIGAGGGIDDFVEAMQGRPSARNSSEGPCSPRTASSYFTQSQGSRKSNSYGSYEGSKESASSRSRSSHAGHNVGSMRHQRMSSNSHQSISEEKENVLPSRKRESSKTRSAKSVSELPPKTVDSRRHSRKIKRSETVSSSKRLGSLEDEFEESRSTQKPIVKDSPKEGGEKEEKSVSSVPVERSHTETLIKSEIHHHSSIAPTFLSPNKTSSNSKPSSIHSVEHISDFQRRNHCQTVSKIPLKVMVVEDDPINRLILKKKLTISGHSVSLTVHGQEAFELFERNPTQFDLILMDLQMPICDGLEATRKIREFEKKLIYQEDLRNGGGGIEVQKLPKSHQVNAGVPIIAVSASLHERQRTDIQSAGMDGWILKPVDFDRLATLMIAAVDLEIRHQLVYKPGTWDQGGWLNSPASPST